MHSPFLPTRGILPSCSSPSQQIQFWWRRTWSERKKVSNGFNEKLLLCEFFTPIKLKSKVCKWQSPPNPTWQSNLWGSYDISMVWKIQSYSCPMGGWGLAASRHPRGSHRGRKSPDLWQPVCICLLGCLIDQTEINPRINPSLQKLSFPTSSPFIYCPFSSFYSNKTGAWHISHSETLIHRPILREEDAITPLPAVSQGTGRGETNLPTPAACLPLSCHPSEDAETCLVPQSLSTYPSSRLHVQPLHLFPPPEEYLSMCPSSCQFCFVFFSNSWIFWFKFPPCF